MFWETGGHPENLVEPMYSEHANSHTDNNLKLGFNQKFWTCETAVLPVVPLLVAFEDENVLNYK